MSVWPTPHTGLLQGWQTRLLVPWHGDVSKLTPCWQVVHFVHSRFFVAVHCALRYSSPPQPPPHGVQVRFVVAVHAPVSYVPDVQALHSEHFVFDVGVHAAVS